MAQVSGTMARRLASLAQSALKAGEQAGAFGDQLSGLSHVLASRDVEQLRPRLTEVISRADAALYAAKKAGRDRVVTQT